MIIERRGFITGLAALIAAPAIVRASSIMPVRGIVMDLYGRSPALAAMDDLRAIEKMERWQIRWQAVGDLFWPGGVKLIKVMEEA